MRLVDQLKAGPLLAAGKNVISRHCSSDEVRPKFGGIGACHLTLIILVAV
jgi:hypothetical protein